MMHLEKLSKLRRSNMQFSQHLRNTDVKTSKVLFQGMKNSVVFYKVREAT